MNNEINLSAYDDVERRQLELGQEELYHYYLDKMDSAQSDIIFIKKILGGGRYSFCEIGCGNGKLLCGLEKEDVLSYGCGYEVSKSRYRMAQKFCGMANADNVELINANFLEKEDDHIYDMIIMVDIVFQMIVNLYDEALYDTINWIRNHLKPNGVLFLEIEDMSHEIESIKKEGEERKWYEFSKSDPYIYGLFRLRLQDNNNVEYEKIFIEREGYSINTTKSIWRSFSKEEIKEVLEESGFRVSIYDYYNSKQEKVKEIKEGTYRNNIFRVIGDI